MAKIKKIKAWEILDSRGKPTICTEVYLDNGLNARASVPSGASRGSHEAWELRDSDIKRYQGFGVQKAIKKITQVIAPKLIGFDPCRQQEIDKLLLSLDGTENKSNLGGNAILSVSLACARVASLILGLPLYSYLQNLSGLKVFKFPVPLFNLINGGLHASGNLTFQEFFYIPFFSLPYPEALQSAAELIYLLKKELQKKGFSTAVGDEGGFSPAFSDNEEALFFLFDCVKKLGFQDSYLGLDLAASNFYKNGFYYPKKSQKGLTSEEFIAELQKLQKKFNLFLLEDPLFEDDWQGWVKLNEVMGKNSLIVGDDLLVTNKKRLQKAIKMGACNSALIKVNQIGTLTETLEVINLAKSAGFKIIISHRSGETNDSFIADLAIGVGADFVKFGAPVRGERVAKYNRLLEIYSELNYG